MFRNMIFYDLQILIFIGKTDMLKRLAARILKYDEIRREDIATFTLYHTLILEEKLGWTGVIYNELIEECRKRKLVNEKEKDSSIFIKLVRSNSIKDMIFFAGIRSSNFKVTLKYISASSLLLYVVKVEFH